MAEISIDECFTRGMLKKVESEMAKIKGSINLANHYLERSKGNIAVDYADVAFLMAYNAMFQLVRALLFDHGVKERSHYCAIKYLKKIYSKNREIAKYLEIIDNYRQNRHFIQYEGALCTIDEAKQALKDAEKFCSNVKRILKM